MDLSLANLVSVGGTLALALLSSRVAATYLERLFEARSVKRRSTGKAVRAAIAAIGRLRDVYLEVGSDSSDYARKRSYTEAADLRMSAGENAVLIAVSLMTSNRIDSAREYIKVGRQYGSKDDATGAVEEEAAFVKVLKSLRTDVR